MSNKWLLSLLIILIIFGCPKSEKEDDISNNHYLKDSSILKTPICIFTLDGKDYLICKDNKKRKYLIKKGDLIGKEKVKVLIVDYKNKTFFGKDDDDFTYNYALLPCFENQRKADN